MSQTALDAAREATERAAGPELTPDRRHVCVDCAGQGSPEVVLTLARFGRWAEVLQETLPLTCASAT